MSKVARFRKGQVVKAKHNTILVTGPGDKSLGYPVFAGVTIETDRSIDSYPIGEYSDTWTTEACKRVPLDLNLIVKLALVEIPADV